MIQSLRPADGQAAPNQGWRLQTWMILKHQPAVHRQACALRACTNSVENVMISLRAGVVTLPLLRLLALALHLGHTGQGYQGCLDGPSARVNLHYVLSNLL